VKEAVFPFIKFPGVDVVLGPEMKSTGEVMGIDLHFPIAYFKAQEAAGNRLPLSGCVFVSVKDRDKPKVVNVVKKLKELGFRIVATRGTARFLQERGIEVDMVYKVHEGRPHVVDFMKNGYIDMVINTTYGGKARKDSYIIRRTALNYGIPYFTTIEGAQAAVLGIEALKKGEITVRSIQEYHRDIV